MIKEEQEKREARRWGCFCCRRATRLVRSISAPPFGGLRGSRCPPFICASRVRAPGSFPPPARSRHECWTPPPETTTQLRRRGEVGWRLTPLGNDPPSRPRRQPLTTRGDPRQEPAPAPALRLLLRIALSALGPVTVPSRLAVCRAPLLLPRAQPKLNLTSVSRRKELQDGSTFLDAARPV
jgi:hypothetical protein